MILVVFGTTGELIKLAPVLLRLDERGGRYVLATTGQQVQQIPSFLEQFGLRQPDVWLARGAGGRDLRVNSDIPGWAARVARSWLRERRNPFAPVSPSLITSVRFPALRQTRTASRRSLKNCASGFAR